MPLTDKYDLPWPRPSDFVKDGSTAIRSLAEAVEAALRPPLLVTSGDGVTAWSAKVAEIGWDSTENADRKRGSWDSIGAADQLVVPNAPGYYQVNASVRFGGKPEPDWYDLQIRTRQQGSAVGSGDVWAETRSEQPANDTSFFQITIAAIVRIPDTSPRTGIAIRASYNGAANPPDVTSGVNKLSIHRLSAL
jgi:hypothetical protein